MRTTGVVPARAPGSVGAMSVIRLVLLSMLLPALLTAADGAISPRQVQVGNLVYAGTKTSKCFSDAFLGNVGRDTGINLVTRFITVKAAKAEELAQVGFAVMTGEGAFTLQADERTRLKGWLENGGFLLASAGCSSKEWSASLRHEITTMFGEDALTTVSAEHQIFQTLYDVRSITLKKDGKARFEGVIVDGRMVCLFSHEGLNDTAQVQGCCCCGGNEITNARQVVANALVYALVE
jgi:hypothetical protein